MVPDSPALTRQSLTRNTAVSGHKQTMRKNKMKTVLTIEFDNDRINEILPALANIDGVAITAAANQVEPFLTKAVKVVAPSPATHSN